MNTLKIKSYAKINLSLDILSKMENGYHELSMIMQLIDLHDDIKLQWFTSDEGGLKIQITTDKSELPVDKRNIAYKSAFLLMEKYCPNINGKLFIDIKKNIPIESGLAGGSSNGAAVLLCLNRLWNLNLNLAKLCDIGGLIGSDVPFSMRGIAKVEKCLGYSDNPLAGTCAWAQGTGTQLTMLPPLKSDLVLSKPLLGVSTKEVYQGMDYEKVKEHPNVAEQIQGLKNKDCLKIKNNMINVLENYTLKRYYEVVYTKNKMQEVCSQGIVLMSGSGPTIFALTSDKEETERVYTSLLKQNRETYVAKTIS